MLVSEKGSPRSEAELLTRARTLHGETLGKVAEPLGEKAPGDLRRHKGWVGQLMELYLGATASSRSEPDFPELGVELKTLPVDLAGKPLESTFVCTIELSEISRTEWRESRLWRKMARVLWVPVQGGREVPVSERMIGSPYLWSPNEREEALLRRDWEQLSSLIGLGQTGEITAHLGEALQVRPKGAKGSSRRLALDDEGALYSEQPKGFYLRSTFTRSVLSEALLRPRS